MASRPPLVVVAGQIEQLQAGDTLAGAGGGGGVPGVLTIASGVVVNGGAGTGSVITYLFTPAKASDGTALPAQGGTLPNPAAALFTASADMNIRILFLGNPSGSDVSGITLALGALSIPGPSTIFAGGYAVLCDDGWKNYNANGGLIP